MKTISHTLVALALIFFAACHSTKKQSKSVSDSSTQTSTTASTSSTTSSVPTVVRPSNGVYAPGTAEVNAIIMQHSDVTLEKLTQGYTIYSKGECTNCHGPKNIYRNDDTQWKYILDDMAMKANLTASQKDAVSNYVFAIRAAKPH